VSDAASKLLTLVNADIGAGRFELPILPTVANEVLQASGDEAGGAKKLADIVRRDQTMAAHLLRMANSPFYRGTDAIVSVQHAVSRLGSSRIREVALVVACSGRVFEVGGFEDEVKASFKHSLAAALYAQEIARAKRTSVEDAFLAGLLHDMGRPLLLQKCIDVDKKHALKSKRAEILGVVDQRHPSVGAMLATAWLLPERLASTIADHHHAGPPEERSPAVHMVMLADALAHYAMTGTPNDAIELRTHPAIPALNLYPDAVSALLSRAQVVKETAGALA